MDGVVPIISVSLQVSKPVGSTFHVVLKNQTEDSVLVGLPFFRRGHVPRAVISVTVMRQLMVGFMTLKF